MMLIDRYGWQGTCLVTGAIVLHTIPFSLFYGKAKIARRLSLIPDDLDMAAASFYQHRLLRPAFYFYIVTVSVGNVFFLITITFVVRQLAAVEDTSNYSEQESFGALVLIAHTLTHSLVRILMSCAAWLITAAERHRGKSCATFSWPASRLAFLQLALLALAVFYGAFAFARSRVLLLAFAIAIGVARAIESGLRPSVALDVFGKQHYLEICGFSQLALGIGMLVGYSLNGVILQFGDYRHTYLACALCAFISFCSISVIHCRFHYRSMSTTKLAQPVGTRRILL